MAPETDHAESVRALRQLRKIRMFYAAGAALWAVSAASSAWDEPGGRQMWVSLVFLVVFAALLVMSSLWLRRRQADGSGEAVHHAAPRRAALGRHANA
ncbi:hypothetical protein [Streptomyces djakartensis]|jgi:hypothetical protein|uniref:hypothetical protein n=1 Tax=Streptomyces djakartensis TaxID=68193 RepID=UPI0034DF6DBD